MKPSKISRKLVALFVLSLSLCTCAALAGQGVQVLRGRVVDQFESVVVGATVTLKDSNGVEKTAVTNGEGTFQIGGLSPGSYVLIVKAAGFEPFENKAVRITVRGMDALTVKLGVEEKKENVDVSAADNRPQVGVDPENTASGIVLRGQDLEFLSDDPDQLASDLLALAGPAEGPDGSQILVDGFTGAKVPPKSSIREVRISADPYAAQQDFFGFGRIEIFTKPGADKLSGQAFFNYSNDHLNARNPFSTTRTPYQSRIYGANVSGPIFAKRGSFFLDFGRREINEIHTVSAFVLDPSFNIIPFVDAIAIPQRRSGLSGRFDYRLNNNNTLIARYDYSRLGAVVGLGDLSLRSRAYDGTFVDHVFQVTETNVLSPSVLNETRFQYRHSDYSRQGDNSTPTINVQGAFVGGGSEVGLAGSRGDNFELTNATFWTKSTHTIRFGGRLRGVRLNEIAPTNFGGTYIFSSLEQFRDAQRGVAGARPTQFSISGGNPEVSVTQVDFGGFAQDDWRVRPNFTLSYGLRYEMQTNVRDKIDLAPRIAFAWAPSPPAKGAPHLVIRGGFGIFYNRFDEGLTLESRRLDGITQQQFLVADPAFFPRVPALSELSSSAVPQTVRRVASDLNVPYVIGASISVDRQLPRNTTISLAYIYKGARQLLRSRNINAPLPGTFNPNVAGSGVRPLGDVGNVFVFESGGVYTDHTMYFSINSRPSAKLNFFGRVGLSKENGDTEGPYSFPADSYNLEGEYGRGLNDRRIFTSFGMNYNAFWGLSVNLSMFTLSANRFNITTGFDNNGDGVFTDRPAFANDPNKPGVVQTPFGNFDPNPEPGQQIIPRNFGEGRSTMQATMRVGKTFKFGTIAGQNGAKPSTDKRYGMTVYVLGQNIFNRPNMGPISGNLSSPRFGQPFTITNFPRRIETGVRLSF